MAGEQDELLACPNPWCYSHEPSRLAAGRRPYIYPNTEDGGPVHVRCPCCPIGGPTKGNVAEAIAAWNRRRPTISDEAVERAEANLQIAREALAPFAAEAANYDPDEGDDAMTAWASRFRIEVFRRARAALAKIGSTP